MRKKPFIKIRTKILLCLMALLIPIIVVVDIGIYRTYKADVEKQVVDLSEEVIEQKALNIRSSMKTLEENILYKIEGCGLFKYQDNLAEASVYNIERDMKNFAALLKSMNMEVKSVYILDRYSCTFYCDNEGVLYEGYEGFKKNEVYSFIRNNLDWLSRQSGKTIWRNFSDDSDHVYMIKNVLDLSTVAYRGILCVQLKKEFLSSLVDSRRSNIVLYDEEGNLLYANEDILDRIDVSEEKENLKKDYLLSEEAVPVKKWKLVSFNSKKAVLEQMSELIRELVIFEAGLALLAAFLAAYIARNITSNIAALIQGFHQINSGKEAMEIPYRSHDETAFLCEKFNDMNRKLRDSVEQITENSIQREKAEYNALMAQMNPHFLYNTLESIGSMAKLQGQKEIVDCIKKLSHLLRVSISTNTQEISLSQELSYTEKYLELQRMIGGERLSWDIICENGTENCMVPKLFLQPLVENSVIHGVGNMTEDAMIVIMVQREQHSYRE